MNRLKKRAATLIACVCALLVLMFAAVLIAPQLVDTQVVRDKVRSEIKDASGVEIDFKHLRLTLFPQPFVILDQVKLSLPPNVKGTAASMRIQPKISPLFQRKFQLAAFDLDSAELEYTLPIKSGARQTSPSTVSFADMGKSIQSALPSLQEFNIPDLEFKVSKGKVNVFDGKRKILAFSSINFQLEGAPTSRKLTLSCTSDLWQTITLSGLLNTKTLAGNGQLQLSRLDPQGLAALQPADSAFQLIDAPADLTINFITAGPGQLQAQADGVASHLKLRYAGEVLNLKNPHIKAAFTVKNGSISVSVPELTLDHPRLNVTADLHLSQTSPLASLQVKGTHIDVAEVRKSALALLGNNKTINSIFDSVRRGNIPLITLKSQGRSLSELWSMDTIVLNGQIHNGEIHIPEPRLDLTDVSGDAVITDGILNSKKFSAHLGNLSGKNGTLKLDLLKDQTPFSLEIGLQTELAQLPAILKRFIDNKDLQKGFAIVQKMKGGATAQLVLSKDRGKVQVEVTDFLLKEAVLCGISLKGTGKSSAEFIEYNLEVFARDQKLKSTLDCFADKGFKADGRFRLKGNFQGHGKKEDLLDTSTGQIEVSIPDGGRIYKDTILLSILKILDPVKVVTGKINSGEMGTKGFGYHSFRMDAKLQDGKLRYDNAVLLGQPMTIIFAGENDLHTGKVDVTMLVAPLVSMHRIFEHIPLIGPALDSLDTVPFRVKGTVDNFHIYPLAPSAVGYKLQKMMENTVQRPIKLIQKSAD